MGRVKDAYWEEICAWGEEDGDPRDIGPPPEESEDPTPPEYREQAP